MELMFKIAKIGRKPKTQEAFGIDGVNIIGISTIKCGVEVFGQRSRVFGRASKKGKKS